MSSSNDLEDDFLQDFADDSAAAAAGAGAGDGEEDDDDDSSSEGHDDDDVALDESSASLPPTNQLKHDAGFLSLLDYISSSSSPAAAAAAGADDLEQRLNQANLYLHKLAAEMLAWHRLASRAYSPIFPELEKLVVDAVDFARVLLLYGECDEPKGGDLSQILNNATVMVVKVSKSAHANSIANLGDNKAELRFALQCAQEILALEAHRSVLLDFCESQVSAYAPNLYELVGSRTAALLLSLSGGLRKLSQIPSNDIQVLGKRNKGDTAQSHGENFVFLRHAGVLAQCPLVLAAPQDLRRKLVRVLAGRVGLAARVDESSSNSSTSNNGKMWREEIETKLRQWQEPNQGKLKKALPVPDQQRAKRRGGRRARKLKEKLGSTLMLKLANRERFGGGGEGGASASGVEYSVSAMGEDLGMLTHQQSGRVRQVQAKNTQHLGERAANSKRLRQINTTGGSLASGFTSLAFTPVQGMELGAASVAPGAATSSLTDRKKPAVPLFRSKT